jgi:hypothetical protein
MSTQCTTLFLFIWVCPGQPIQMQDSLPMNAKYTINFNTEIRPLLQLEHDTGANNLELVEKNSYYSAPSAFAYSDSMVWLLYNWMIYKYNLHGILQDKIVLKDAIDFNYCDSSIFVYCEKRLLQLDFHLKVIKITNLEHYKVKDYSIGGVSAFRDKYFFLNNFDYKTFNTVPGRVIALSRWGATDTLTLSDSARIKKFGCRNCIAEISAKKEYLGESARFLVYAYRQVPFTIHNVGKIKATQYFVFDKELLEVQPLSTIIRKELKGLRLNQACLRPVSFSNDSTAVFQVISPSKKGNIGVFYYQIVFH